MKWFLVRIVMSYLSNSWVEALLPDGVRCPKRETAIGVGRFGNLMLRHLRIPASRSITSAPIIMRSSLFEPSDTRIQETSQLTGNDFEPEPIKSFVRHPVRIIVWAILLLLFLSVSPPPSSSLDSAQGSDLHTFSWNFGEGRTVQLSTPLVFSKRQLTDPTLLGVGGSGAVFAMTATPTDGSQVSSLAVKVSWSSSADSVDKECRILRTLEKYSVHHVERCLDRQAYPIDPSRVIILLQPVVESDASNRIDNLESNNAQARATQQLMQTLVEMLAVGVVTTDVQILVSPVSGDMILIDLTEARVLSSPLSVLDMALAGSFCSEMLSLVPPAMSKVADLALDEALALNHLDDGLSQLLSTQREVFQS